MILLYIIAYCCYRFQCIIHQESIINSKVKDAYYNMDHKYRGKAIIFNHEKFEMSDLPPRVGTENDCRDLQFSLNNLGFEVTSYVDLTLNELEKTLEHCMYYVFYT